MTEKEKASELITFMEEEWDGTAIIKALTPLLRDSDLAALYDKMTKEGVIRPYSDEVTDTDSTDNIKELQKEVNNILKENELTTYTEVEVDKDEKVTVHLSWGDWKHDHRRLKYIMAKHGFYHVSEEVTEEDGSDCYSAKHLFVKIDV